MSASSGRREVRLEGVRVGMDGQEPWLLLTSSLVRDDFDLATEPQTSSLLISSSSRAVAKADLGVCFCQQHGLQEIRLLHPSCHPVSSHNSSAASRSSLDALATK